MLLSGGEISEAVKSGHLVIEPFSQEKLQPVSVDLRLHHQLKVAGREPVRGMSLDPETLNIQDHINRYTDLVDLSGGQTWRFEPGRFVIGQTLERVEMPMDLAGRIEGRSRLARLGVGVHITAPKIDPGFRNPIALELYNLGPWTMVLSGGMTICTLMVERLHRPADSGYDGIFQGR